MMSLMAKPTIQGHLARDIKCEPMGSLIGIKKC